MKKWRFFRIALCLPLLGILTECHLQGQPAGAGPADASVPNASDELALSQSRLADKYRNLEKLLLRMAEYDAGLNPQRAEVLKRVFSESRDRQVHLQYEALVRLLEQEQFGRALGNQKQLRTDLDALLKLLMSENRADRIKNEKARLREYIREVERLERMQRSVQGRTEGGIAEGDIAREQQDLAGRTAALQQEIGRNEKPEVDAAEGAQHDSASGESSASESPSESASPQDANDGGESKPSEKESSASDAAESGEAKPSKGGNPSSGESPQGESQSGDSQQGAEPGEGSTEPTEAASGESSGTPSQSPGATPAEGSAGGESEQSSDDFPGQKNLRQAQKAMERATEKVRQAERDGAVQEQIEAAKELAEAKARLEEILRQLREEEIERTLAMLETRVKAMLDMEIRIHDDTVRLDEIAGNSSDRQWELESGKLSVDQRRVVQEADKALLLLREEGSSSAFPETLSQARSDMDQVAVRLGQAKTNAVTQSIEEDIISALEEMLAALKQAQNQQRQRQQESPPGPPADPGDQPLVDQIAELKMIKSLQMRINRRTNRYAQLLEDNEDLIGQATDAELVMALQELSTREARLQELTRDIVLGKNR